mgnify:CR=1 FL=1
MIKVTRFNGKALYINAELIQFVEGTPDTVITLTNETRMVVSETTDEVINQIIAYRQKVYTGITSSESGE